MNYEQALEYIHSTYRFGSKLGLENIKSLLELMGNPQEGLKVIHVAGTNGKGSTSSFINAVLLEQGYRVGLYTSPYLEEFTERIQVNGTNIPQDELGEITGFVKSKVEKMLSAGKNHPTEFEIVTAIGFEYFKRKDVDFLVLEVGLGGRGDSTNVVERPLVSVITPIDYDHMDYLGDTLAKIAFEKAGIIKRNSIVVSYPQQKEAMDVIKEVCKKQGSKLVVAPIEKIEILSQDMTGQSFNVDIDHICFKNISISMLGEHQIQNATLALTVLNALEKEYGIFIHRESIYNGFKKSIWPGRLELMGKNPYILIDGAHNVHGLKALAVVLDKLFYKKNITLGIGVLADKDVQSMLDVIIPMGDRIVITEPNSPRALPVEKLLSLLNQYDKTIFVEKNISKAVAKAREITNEEDVIVFCGSLYMIGQVRSILKS